MSSEYFGFGAFSLLLVLFSALAGFLTVATELTSRRRYKSEKRITDLLEQDAKEVNDLGPVEAQNVDLAQEMYIAERKRLAVIAALGDSYHEQALGQARVQFRVSTIAAVAGFFLIIYNGFIQILGTSVTVSEVVLNTLPGVVIEAVSVLFFAQARSTRQRATDFYSRLQDDQRHKEALSIADGIAEPTLKALVYAQMALHTVGLKTTELDIQSVLNGSSNKLQKAETSLEGGEDA